VAALIRDDDIDFEQYLRETDAPHKVRPASAYADLVIDHFYGDHTKEGVLLPWGKMSQVHRLRPGEVTLWHGISGHGKSLVTLQVMLFAMAQDARVLLCSFEMKPVQSLARMCRMCSNDEEPAIKTIRDFHGWTDGKLWIYDHLDRCPPDKLLAIMRYAMEQHKVDHIVIDSLMKVVPKEDDFNGQKDFVDRLCYLAKDNGLHIHLVHHTRKAGDESKEPGKFDAKGTGAITDLVDNVCGVWRNKAKEAEREKAYPKADVLAQSDQLLIIDKNRHGGWEGRVRMWFDARSGQYVESEHQSPINPMLIRAGGQF